MNSICSKQALSECVGAPTRGLYLLNAFLTDLADATTTKVLAGVSDHSMVMARVDLQVSGYSMQERPCFIYKAAQWSKLNAEFKNTDWLAILGNCSPNEGAVTFLEYVLKVAKKIIPSLLAGYKKALYIQV